MEEDNDNSVSFKTACHAKLRKGTTYVNDWMNAHCCLIQVDENFAGAVPALLKFREQFRGRPGKEFLLSDW